MAKKKLNKTQRKEQRLRKARQWLTNYNGTPKKILKHYKERFKVDTTCALRDLREIGVEFTQEYLDAVKRSEEERIRQKHLKAEKKKQEMYELLYSDCDDYLTQPSKRVTEPEWMSLFANMMSGIMKCSCGASVFYDEDLEAKGVLPVCWHCQNAVTAPAKIVIGKNRVLLNQNTKLTRHHVYNNYDMETVVGSVVQNPKNPDMWGIRNEDRVNWTYEKQDGTQIPVEIGRTAGIANGVKIHFSDAVGEFK